MRVQDRTRQQTLVRRASAPGHARGFFLLRNADDPKGIPSRGLLHKNGFKLQKAGIELKLGMALVWLVEAHQRVHTAVSHLDEQRSVRSKENRILDDPVDGNVAGSTEAAWDVVMNPKLPFQCRVMCFLSLVTKKNPMTIRVLKVEIDPVAETLKCPVTLLLIRNDIEEFHPWKAENSWKNLLAIDVSAPRFWDYASTNIASTCHEITRVNFLIHVDSMVAFELASKLFELCESLSPFVCRQHEC